MTRIRIFTFQENYSMKTQLEIKTVLEEGKGKAEKKENVDEIQASTCQDALSTGILNCGALLNNDILKCLNTMASKQGKGKKRINQKEIEKDNIHTLIFSRNAFGSGFKNKLRVALSKYPAVRSMVFDEIRFIRKKKTDPLNGNNTLEWVSTFTQENNQLVSLSIQEERHSSVEQEKEQSALWVQIFANLPDLTKLVLKNVFTRRGLIYFSQILSPSLKLSELYLSGNDYSEEKDVGLSSVFNYLIYTLKNLSTLVVDDKNLMIDFKQLVEISNVLRFNKTLTDLQILQYNFPAYSMPLADFYKDLRKNLVLTTLKLPSPFNIFETPTEKAKTRPLLPEAQVEVFEIESILTRNRLLVKKTVAFTILEKLAQIGMGQVNKIAERILSFLDWPNNGSEVKINEEGRMTLINEVNNFRTDIGVFVDNNTDQTLYSSAKQSRREIVKNAILYEKNTNPLVFKSILLLHFHLFNRYRKQRIDNVTRKENMIYLLSSRRLNKSQERLNDLTQDIRELSQICLLGPGQTKQVLIFDTPENQAKLKQLEAEKYCELLNFTGLRFERTGEYSRAANCYKEAIAKGNNYPSALQNLELLPLVQQAYQEKQAALLEDKKNKRKELLPESRLVTFSDVKFLAFRKAIEGLDPSSKRSRSLT